MTGETKKQALEKISRGRVEASDGVFAIALLLRSKRRALICMNLSLL
jgi:hypothetical protein